MADILALRTQLRSAQANLAVQQQLLENLENDLGDLPPQLRLRLGVEIVAQGVKVRAAQGTVDAAQAAYTAAVQADPMHATDAGLPLVLLPVRIEPAYLPGANGGKDLAIRVYPDDIHVDSHEPELTAA